MGIIWKAEIQKTVFNLISNSIKGISPLVSNPTGQFVVRDLPKYKYRAPVTVLQSAMTSLHNHRRGEESMKGALIAFPNDRAASIRSGDQHKLFR